MEACSLLMVIPYPIPRKYSQTGSSQEGFSKKGQVIFHLIQLCWVLRPRFMVLECVWPFFENPSWVEPVCEYFRGMGYGVTIRKEQASNYLAQVRTRGILTATRADHWEQAMGPLRALFLGSPPPIKRLRAHDPKPTNRAQAHVRQRPRRL